MKYRPQKEEQTNEIKKKRSKKEQTDKRKKFKVTKQTESELRKVVRVVQKRYRQTQKNGWETDMVEERESVNVMDVFQLWIYIQRGNKPTVLSTH